MTSLRWKTILAFGLIYVVWGSTYLAIRVGVPYMPSAIFAGLRFLIAGGLVLGTLALLRQPVRPSRRDLAILTPAAFLLLVTGNGFVNLAETMVSSGAAALVVATVPLWIVVLEAVLPGGQRLAPRGLAGIALGLAGLGVLNWPQLASGGTEGINPLGVGILLVASLSWAAGTLLLRRKPVALNPFAATGWEMLLGGVLSLGGGALLQGGEPITWNLSLIGSLAYLILFGSIVAFTAYVWLVQHAPPAKVATYAYVNPVIAVFLGAWLLREPLNIYVLGGMGIILLAVFLVSTSRTTAAPAAGQKARDEARLAQSGAD